MSILRQVARQARAGRRFASTESAKSTIDTAASKTKSAADQAANKLKSAVDSSASTSQQIVQSNETIASAADKAKVYADQAQQYATKAFNAVGGKAAGALGGQSSQSHLPREHEDLTRLYSLQGTHLLQCRRDQRSRQTSLHCRTLDAAYQFWGSHHRVADHVQPGERLRLLAEIG